MNKKEIPFKLLTAIETIAQENLDLIKLKEEENTYYSFVEVDETSNNFFKIYIVGAKYVPKYQPGNYVFEYKPTDDSNIRKQTLQGLSGNIGNRFEEWVKLVREVHETPSVHDDNFSKAYSDFYYAEFKIMDDDINTSPFNPKQQDRIERYLKSLTKLIESSNEVTDSDLKEKIILEIKEIETSIPINTKNQVMKKITGVFGKLYKVSRPLAKEAVKEFGKQVMKKIIELGIEYGPKLLEQITKSHGT